MTDFDPERDIILTDIIIIFEVLPTGYPKTSKWAWLVELIRRYDVDNILDSV